MPLVHDAGICLRKHEYSESSQILTLFTCEHGLVRAIAKGAHRRTKAGASKFDGGIDYLDLGRAVFIHDSNRELSTLTEWHLVDGHLALRQNLRAIYLALYAAELVSLLIEEHDPHPDLFDALEQLLQDLPSPRIEELFLAFELNLLLQTGYLPELDTCAICGQFTDHPAAFSPGQGAILCTHCQTPDAIAIDPRLLRLLRSILKLPRDKSTVQRLPRLTRHQTDPLNHVLAQHIHHALPRPMKLLPYVLR